MGSINSHLKTNNHFAPKTKNTPADLNSLLTTPVVEGQVGTLNNISPYNAEEYN